MLLLYGEVQDQEVERVKKNGKRVHEACETMQCVTVLAIAP